MPCQGPARHGHTGQKLRRNILNMHSDLVLTLIPKYCCPVRLNKILWSRTSQPRQCISTMNTYKKLKQIRSLIARLPRLKSYKDFDIAVEIGYHQHSGAPLTLKRLLLLDIAPAATVRRHLSRMVREGTITKIIPPNDHRTAHFMLSEDTMHALDLCLEKIQGTLCESAEGRRKDD